MKKPLLFFLVLVTVTLMAFYITYVEKVPVAIQKDIAARAQERFQLANMSWVTAKVNGRHITLEGVAPSQKAIALAEEIAQVDGYASIDNKLTLAAPTPQITSKTEKFDYKLRISKSERKKVVLTGILNKNSHKLVVASSHRKYGRDNVTDKIKIQNVMTPDFVGQSVDLVMQQLDHFKKGSAEFNQFNFVLEGTFLANISNNNFKQKINEQTRARVVKVNLPIIRPPRHKPFRQRTEASIRRAEECFADFKRINVSSIRFNSASAVVKQSSYKILDKIVAVAKKCNEFNLQIHGHTDSAGSRAKNDELSYQRAFAIVKYLINKNVELNRLEAIGHGSRQPIASNRTKRGRAKNRRIELVTREQ